jgi:hypothetical protein
LRKKSKKGRKEDKGKKEGRKKGRKEKRKEGKKKGKKKGLRKEGRQAGRTPTGGHDGPGAAPEVHRDSINDVIDLAAEEKVRPEQVDAPADGADDHGRPRFHNITSGRDAYQTAEEAVQRLFQVELSRLPKVAEEERHQPPRASGNGRVDRGTGGDEG